MLSAKPWKLDAIARLLLSLIIFMFAGSLVASTIYYVGAGGKVAARFFLLGSGALVFLGATLVLISRRWTLENLRCRLIVLMICLYAGMGLWAWAQKIAGPAPLGHPPWQMIIGTLSFQGAVLLLSLLFVRWHQVTWREAFGLSNHWHQAILFGALTALIFFPVASWLQRASVELIKGVLHLHVKGEEQLAVQTLRHAVSWLDQVTLGAVTILLVPAGEEVLFRGILYPWIKRAGFPRLALWGTALLFAGIHWTAMIFLPLFVLALLLTGLYEKTNNLLSPITAHAMFNALNFTMLCLQQRAAIPH